MPRAPVLHKIADYFHVTADYLVGLVNDPFFSLDNEKIKQEINSYGDEQEKKPTLVSEDELHKLDENLIKRLVDLYPDEIAKVDAFVQGLLAARGD